MSGAAVLLVWLAMTGCHSQQIALRFRAMPIGHASDVVSHQGEPNNGGHQARATTLAFQHKAAQSAKPRARRLPGHRNAFYRKKVSQILSKLSALPMPTDTLKPIKRPKKLFLDNYFMRPGRHDTDTSTTLAIMGSSALTVACLISGVGIAGLLGWLLLLLSGVFFLLTVPYYFC